MRAATGCNLVGDSARPPELPEGLVTTSVWVNPVMDINQTLATRNFACRRTLTSLFLANPAGLSQAEALWGVLLRRHKGQFVKVPAVAKFWSFWKMKKSALFWLKSVPDNCMVLSRSMLGFCVCLKTALWLDDRLVSGHGTEGSFGLLLRKGKDRWTHVVVDAAQRL